MGMYVIPQAGFLANELLSKDWKQVDTTSTSAPLGCGVMYGNQSLSRSL